jgi:hypothetical protein
MTNTFIYSCISMHNWVICIQDNAIQTMHDNRFQTKMGNVSPISNECVFECIYDAGRQLKSEKKVNKF